jgi:hypothetical protein
MSEAAAREVEAARRRILVERSSDLLLGIPVAVELLIRIQENERWNYESAKLPMSKHEVAELFRRALKAEEEGTVSTWVPLYKQVMTEFLRHPNLDD